jgi:hypothetical protein
VTQSTLPRTAKSGLILAVLALCLMPLFVTPVIPTVDFYSHVARFYILGTQDAHPMFLANYAPSWRLLPNLGLDVIGTGVMTLVPPLLGAKLLAALIILAPVLGCLSLTRAIHGRIEVTHLALAGLLAHNLILGWGFANFLLGLGLALWALGLWIRLAGRPGRQLAVAVALGVAIFLVHGLVFALWGLLLAAVELPALWRYGAARALGRVARLALVALLPVVLFLMSRTAQAEDGVTKAFANLSAHAEQGNLGGRLVEEALKRIDSLLRVAESTFPVLDRAFGLGLWLVLICAMALGALRPDPRLRVVLAMVAALVVLTPPNMFGVGHLDERIPLVLLALLAATLRAGPRPNGRAALALPSVLLAALTLHLALVSFGWWREGRSYDAYLTATQTLPEGGLATIAYIGAMQERDLGRACKPLLPLLLLTRGMAIDTFANPTQQPLAIIGPLDKARKSEAALPPDLDPPTRLSASLQAGFRTIVTCAPPETSFEAPAGLRLVAQDGRWRLYQAD